MIDVLRKIIAQGEGETLEFKSSFTKEVVETIVAFSNTKGGKIILGCNDKKEIIGVALSDESIQKWTNEIKQFGTHYTAIHIGRFKTRETIIDDIVIRSPLILAVEEAMNFIKRNITLSYRFTGELKREERWQFPLQAIRELLLNAFIGITSAVVFAASEMSWKNIRLWNSNVKKLPMAFWLP
jgi:ATP-dependent DNA helicase RecG